MPLIIAHRGASLDAPENTLAAFRLAFEQGADGIEGDFRRTADGHVVCCHDATTRRCTDRDLVVADASLAELRTLDAGAWKSAVFAGERMPTLGEVLATLPPGKRAFLELKGATPGLAAAVAAVIGESGVDPSLLRLIAFDLAVVLDARRRLPDVAVSWLVEYSASADSDGALRPPAVLATLREHDIEGLGSQADPLILTPDVVAALRADGRSVHVYTVDTPERAVALAALGVDSITTNRPAALRAVVPY